jgi:hypothetical protein
MAAACLANAKLANATTENEEMEYIATDTTMIHNFARWESAISTIANVQASAQHQVTWSDVVAWA